MNEKRRVEKCGCNVEKMRFCLLLGTFYLLMLRERIMNRWMDRVLRNNSFKKWDLIIVSFQIWSFKFEEIHKVLAFFLYMNNSVIWINIEVKLNENLDRNYQQLVNRLQESEYSWNLFTHWNYRRHRNFALLTNVVDKITNTKMHGKLLWFPFLWFADDEILIFIIAVTLSNL